MTAKIYIKQLTEYYDLCRAHADQLEQVANSLKNEDTNTANDAWAKSVQFDCLAAMLKELINSFKTKA